MSGLIVVDGCLLAAVDGVDDQWPRAGVAGPDLIVGKLVGAARDSESDVLHGIVFGNHHHMQDHPDPCS